MAARHPLSALKLSCRTLKHVVMAAAASSSSSSSENACILLLPRRIDDPCAGDRAPRNDNDKDEKELEEEEEDEEEEADLGLPGELLGVPGCDSQRNGTAPAEATP